MILTPFTDEQVQALNRWQNRQDRHPFTCGKCDSRVPLIATTDGWRCGVNGCDYRQNWAHDFMALEAEK